MSDWNKEKPTKSQLVFIQKLMDEGSIDFGDMPKSRQEAADIIFEYIGVSRDDIESEASGRERFLNSFESFLDLYVEEGGKLRKTSIVDMVKWCCSRCGNEHKNECSCVCDSSCRKGDTNDRT